MSPANGLIAMGGAAVLTWGSGFVVLRLLLARHLVDIPSERSSHQRPTPRGGGITCIFGILGGAAIAALMGSSVGWAALGIALGLALVGLLDDLGGLPPVGRLLAQAAAGAGAGLVLGGGWSILIGMLAIPVVVNAVNFMDGINGITSLSAGLWGVVALILGWLEGSSPLLILGAVCAGAACGFLPWNAPTARMFLGDVGSYLFGGLIAIGILTGAAADPSTGLVLISPLALYLIDTGTVLARRLLRGDRLFQAHREHTYQQLANECGLRHLSVAAIVAALSLAMTLAWTLTAPPIAAGLTVAIGLCYLLSPQIIWARRRRRLGQGRDHLDD